MSVFTIFGLTIREAQRRRLLGVGLLLGTAFLVVFAIGFYVIYREFSRDPTDNDFQFVNSFLLSAGFYAINFLVTIMTVLVSVTTISSEIDSHTIDAIVTKPIGRWEVVLGKWLAFAALLVIYLLFLAFGLILIVYVQTGFLFDNIPIGLAIMTLQILTILSLTIAGGTRLSTIANGIVAFMLYGVAFLGGWVEQIGAMLANEAAVDIGIFTSLIMPTEIMWKKALSLFQPGMNGTTFVAGPFTVVSQPSNLMVVYAVIYTAALLLFALWSFTRRDL